MIDRSRSPLGAIHLDRGKDAPLQTQLHLQVKGLIQRGTLQPGQAIPSSRDVASDLQVSRNTVVAAFDRLVGEGYLDARPRAGLFVSETLAQRASWRDGTQPTATATPRPPRIGAPRPFRPCQPDVRLFPLALWNRLRARVLRTQGTKLLHYQSAMPSGLPALRQSIAAYLRDSRGVECDWRQVAITTGSQQALFLLAQLLVRCRDRVLLEDPGYLGARRAFSATGATLQCAPVDGDGLTLPARQAAPLLIYTTPSRQFPTGACLPLARRLALIEFATQANAWIVEDDYDSEFRYARPPLPSLHSLDSHGRVIYVGTMSKVLFPSLRVGYAVLPESLVEHFAEARSVMDDHGPLIDQATLAEFIASGAFYTHIRRCRREYGERMSVFLEAMEDAQLPLTFPHRDGGMNICGFLDASVDDGAVSAAAVNFELPPLSHYSLRAKRTGLVFGFTAFGRSTIRGAVREIARLLRPVLD